MNYGHIIIRTILRLERLRSSANGNPRWLVIFTDGERRETQSDASVAYEIGNPEFQGVPVEVTLNRSGKITYAKPV